MDEFLSMNETDKLIENLKHFSKVVDFNSYSYLKNILDQLVIPFPVLYIQTGKLLYRSRRHLDNENYFFNISDISNRQDIFRISEFGRANEPCQSIFYCSDQNEIAMAETSPILRKNVDIDSDILTTGVWEVRQGLKVASLLNYPFTGQQNPSQLLLDSNAKKIIDSFQDSNTDKLLKIHTFISQEFSKPSEDDPSKYLITCAFANYIYSSGGFDILNHNTTTIDGIIYPSSIFPDFGMNLALLPEVLEEDKIALIGARKSILRRITETQYKEIETFDARHIDTDQNRVDWD